MRSFSKYNEIDQIKEDEMGRAFITHGEEEECRRKARRKETTRKTKT
jgi:hypothetical protein